jgi:hypothetical protein
LDLARQIGAQKGTCFTRFSYLSAALECSRLKAN